MLYLGPWNRVKCWVPTSILSYRLDGLTWSELRLRTWDTYGPAHSICFTPHANVQDWGLQCPSSMIWLFKIYLSQNNPSKCNPQSKMKTSLEVLTWSPQYNLHVTRTNKHQTTNSPVNCLKISDLWPDSRNNLTTRHLYSSPPYPLIFPNIQS
jgi:hypothetical protein